MSLCAIPIIGACTPYGRSNSRYSNSNKSPANLNRRRRKQKELAARLHPSLLALSANLLGAGPRFAPGKRWCPSPERPAKPQKKFWYKDKRIEPFPLQRGTFHRSQASIRASFLLATLLLIVLLTITAFAVAAKMGISPQM